MKNPAQKQTAKDQVYDLIAKGLTLAEILTTLKDSGVKKQSITWYYYKFKKNETI